MKITVEHTDDAENEVILRCRGLDEEMLQVLSLLRSSVQRLCVWREGAPGTALLPPGEVVYCDTVEDWIYVYTADAVYRTALTLAELEGRFGQLGFARVGKSVVVNLHHIKELRSRPAGRIEALLETGERLMVSRHYAPLLRERLGL